jgi:hypothetical protein
MTRLVKPASCYCYARPNHHVDACVRYERLYVNGKYTKKGREGTIAISITKQNALQTKFSCYFRALRPSLASSRSGGQSDASCCHRRGCCGCKTIFLELACVLLCVLFVLRQVATGQNGHTHPLVDHETRNAHHGSPALVELDAAFIRLPGVRLLVPAKVEGAVPVVAGKFALAGPVAIHDLHEQRGEHELHQHVETALNIIVVQGRKGLEAGRDVLGAGKTQTGGRRQVPRHGEHRHPAVLDLLLTKPGKVVGVLLQNKHGVPKTELL